MCGCVPASALAVQVPGFAGVGHWLKSEAQSVDVGAVLAGVVEPHRNQAAHSELSPLHPVVDTGVHQGVDGIGRGGFVKSGALAHLERVFVHAEGNRPDSTRHRTDALTGLPVEGKKWQVCGVAVG